MWQTFRDVLVSPNASIVLLFLLFVIIVGWILAKTGLLSVSTEKMTLGAANKEREIIRQQVEWIHLHLKVLRIKILKEYNLDKWFIKYVSERMFDEYVEWITFNHLNMSSAYIEIKQDKIINLVHSLVDKENFDIADKIDLSTLDDILREDTKQSISKLIQIRNVYK